MNKQTVVALSKQIEKSLNSYKKLLSLLSKYSSVKNLDWSKSRIEKCESLLQQLNKKMIVEDFQIEKNLIEFAIEELEREKECKELLGI